MTPTSICVPRGSLSCLLQWKSCLRSANGSDSGSFQMVPSSLGLRECEILCVLFKTGVSLSYIPLALLHASPTRLQCQMFGEFVFLEQYPEWGSSMWGLDSLLLHSWLSSHLWVAILGCVFLLWLYHCTVLWLYHSYLSCSSFISLVAANIFC